MRKSRDVTRRRPVVSTVSRYRVSKPIRKSRRSSAAFSLFMLLEWLLWDQHHQLEVGPVGQREADLLVAEAALAWVVEDALAAGAIDHGMLRPASGEELASAAQVID